MNAKERNEQVEREREEWICNKLRREWIRRERERERERIYFRLLLLTWKTAEEKRKIKKGIGSDKGSKNDILRKRELRNR